MGFAICCIIDGGVGVVPFGMLHGRIEISFARFEMFDLFGGFRWGRLRAGLDVLECFRGMFPDGLGIL